MRGRELYLNLYVWFVGPPGTGKTTAIDYARRLVVQVSPIKLTPTKVTKEKFVNIMSKAGSVEIINGNAFQHASYSAFCSEIIVFVPPGDRDWTNVLTDLYDCPAYWSAETISRGTDQVENTFLNILGGITPVLLGSVIPESSIGSGFTSRILFIFAAERVHTDPFDVPPGIESSAFVHDLELVNMLRGPLTYTPEAMETIRDWDSKDMAPAPADSRFADYNSRRLAHWVKLSCLRCISRSDEMTISKDDVLKAKADLLEAEAEMPRAFASIGANPLNLALDHVHKWMMIQYAITKTGVPEAQLRQKLISQIPLQYVDYAVEQLLSSALAMHLGGTKPNRFFIPKNPLTVPRRES